MHAAAELTLQAGSVLMMNAAAERRQHRVLSSAAERRNVFFLEQVLFVEFNPVTLQEGAKFVFEGQLFVMLCLVSNVIAYGLDVRWAYRKCAESTLPCERSLALKCLIEPL